MSRQRTWKVVCRLLIPALFAFHASEGQAAPSGKAKAPAPARAPSEEQAARLATQFQTYLTAAVRLYESLEYEQALEKLARAKTFARDTEDDASLSVYEGIVLADLGRRQQSMAAFRAGLLLKPEATLPLKVSPKVEKDFEKVRTDVFRELGLKPRSRPESEAPKAVALTPTDSSTQAPLPSPVESVRPGLGTTPGLVGTTSTSRPRVLPYALMGGGAAVTGAGVVLGLSALSFNERKREMTASEAALARTQASSQLSTGTVLLGGGLAALGAGVVLWLLPPGGTERPATESKASLMLTPLPGGLAVGSTGHF